MKLMIIALSSLFFISVHAASEIEIMSYNVENLFDAVHDQDKEDWEFTPANAPGKAEYCQTMPSEKDQQYCMQSTWDEARLDIKLNQIKTELSSRPALPDILGLIEVENENVVERLRQTLGYDHFVMTNSPDKRGIDVAIMYKDDPAYKFISYKEHVLTGPTFGEKPTRNILEVHFDVGGGRILGIFQNHWPSQAAPAEVRVGVAKQVATFVDQFMAAGKGKRYAIVMGDFNTLPQDFPHPFNQALLLGQTKLQDVQSLFMGSTFIADETKKGLARGTYFYPPDMSWNMLDHFFVTENLNDGKGLEMLLHTFSIYRSTVGVTSYTYKDRLDPNFGSKIEGIPFRYDPSTMDAAKAGFSDHFPIVIKLALGANFDE